MVKHLRVSLFLLLFMVVAFDGFCVDRQSYLQSGSQSTISIKNQAVIDQELGDPEPGMDTLRAIYEWKRDNFTTSHAHGAYIGTQTVNHLIKTRVLTGCNDHALLVASVARYYGIPAVLVNAAGIKWARDYIKGKTKLFTGHAFLEFYIDGSWIIVDSVNGEYVPIGYNPDNPALPFINSMEPIGYYSYLKGLDLADSGVFCLKDLTNRMKDIAPEAAAAAGKLPYYETSRLLD